MLAKKVCATESFAGAPRGRAVISKVTPVHSAVLDSVPPVFLLNTCNQFSFACLFEKIEMFLDLAL